jgi:hypothetical protein
MALRWIFNFTAAFVVLAAYVDADKIWWQVASKAGDGKFKLPNLPHNENFIIAWVSENPVNQASKVVMRFY